MSTYKTRSGDSPAIIARRHGTSVSALLTANPHKPTTVVSGPDGKPKTTWQGLRPSERLNMPVGIGALGDDVGLGDAVTDMASINPCLQASVAAVCAAQRMLGVTVDGKWGSGSSAAAAKRGINVPACSPRPAWWAPVGKSNCSVAAASTPAASGSSLDRAAGTAYSTLKSDPNYCASVRRAGTAVNTAVHNFKAAWNAANPSRAVPIGTGNYEPVVAAALSSALAGIAVPPGCGAAPTTAQVPSGGGGAVTPTAVAGPAAVQALVGINPCLQASSGVVYAAQVALGIKADGKYGPGTAAAARVLVQNAPAACSPAPLWWGAKGTAQAAAATQTAKTAATTPVVGPGGTRCPEFSNYDAATGECVPYEANLTLSDAQRAAAATAAADAQAKDAAIKAAAATTQAQLDQAAADAVAAKTAADKAAATATTQAQKDAADAAAKIAADALAAATAKGGTTTGAITHPEKKEGISTGAIVAGALGVAAVVGLVALAVSGKKPGARGARGTRGARGPKRRKSSSKRNKSAKRRR